MTDRKFEWLNDFDQKPCVALALVEIEGWLKQISMDWRKLMIKIIDRIRRPLQSFEFINSKGPSASQNTPNSKS